MERTEILIATVLARTTSNSLLILPYYDSLHYVLLQFVGQRIVIIRHVYKIFVMAFVTLVKNN